MKKNNLLNEIRNCTECKFVLPHKPRPVVNFNRNSRILIIGQAPGLKVHQSGVPWDDASGERLRSWLNISTDDFYNADKFGIVPMGFCYPGKGKSGDLPPRRECAELWMKKVLEYTSERKMIILIGQYAQNYFLKKTKKKNLTETVRSWKEYLPNYFVLPHPSPRNNIWLKRNSWFETQALKGLRDELYKVL